MTASRFRLAAPGGADVLGVWQADPAAESFAAAGGADEDVWRVELAADAPAALADRAAALGAAAAAGDEADRRLTGFLRSAGRPPAGAGRATGGPPSPERELAAWVAGQSAGPAASFWPGWFGGWRETAREALDFLRRSVRSLTVLARIETSVGGELVGRTTAGWLGSAETAWRAGAGPESVRRHLAAVALALGTRRAWVRLAGVLVSGAAGLAALVASPAGWVLAVPAAWRFVRRVMAEVRRPRAAPPG